MKINTKQAAEILGVNSHTICDLVKNGKLKDLATNGEGKTKHIIVLDGKEVRAFKSVYKKRVHYKNIPPIPSNGIPDIPVHVETKTPMNGIMTRLGNIETKLNLLIKMWS